MTILHELHHRRPDLIAAKDKEVWIDGGVTRGTDVLKALCLGAKGVGLGRAFLYGNGAWGEDGVRRVVESEFSPFQLYLLIANYCSLFSYERRDRDGHATSWCDENRGPET